MLQIFPNLVVKQSPLTCKPFGINGILFNVNYITPNL